MKLSWITPDDEEALLKYYDDLRFLHHFLPKDVKCETRKFIRTYAGFCTLVYSGRVVLGCFVLYPVQGTSKRSLEIHGVYRQDLDSILGRENAKEVMKHIYGVILDTAFSDKEKVIAKVTPGARLARFWLIRHGFEQVNNTDRGRTVWKLEKRKYLNGR